MAQDSIEAGEAGAVAAALLAAVAVAVAVGAAVVAALVAADPPAIGRAGRKRNKYYDEYK